jgi:glycosyltransferase involved in cell wall biosynthesis
MQTGEIASYPTMNSATGIRPLVSVVSPVYGCAGCIERLCERVFAALAQAGCDAELVLVCDASPDDSWDRIVEVAALDARVRGLRFSRNFGQHAAISAGLLETRGDWIVVMDCDLQDPPEYVPALLARAREGFDAVFAERKQRRDNWFKRTASRAFYATLGHLTGERYNPETANFGVYSRALVDAILSLPETARFFPLLVRWVGFRHTSVPVQHAERDSGRSGYSLRKALQLALDAIMSFSDRPLRLVVRVGLLFSLVSFLFVAYSIVRYLSGDIAVAGFTSIIASVWLVGGTTIACLGVVGLYVGRIFGETKRRPHFIVAERVNAQAGRLPRPGAHK